MPSAPLHLPFSLVIALWAAAVPLPAAAAGAWEGVDCPGCVVVAPPPAEALPLEAFRSRLSTVIGRPADPIECRELQVWRDPDRPSPPVTLCAVAFACGRVELVARAGRVEVARYGVFIARPDCGTDRVVAIRRAALDAFVRCTSDAERHAAIERLATRALDFRDAGDVAGFEKSVRETGRPPADLAIDPACGATDGLRAIVAAAAGAVERMSLHYPEP